MDADIDFLKWTRPNLPANDGTKRLKPLIDELFDKIFPHGVSQIVGVPTRMWAGRAESDLDHLYTNHTEKLSEVTRFSKSLPKRARYVRKG